MPLTLNPITRRIKKAVFGKKLKKFNSSGDFWETRYKFGGNSGKGSYGQLAQFKAGTLNDFVKKNNINSVIEYGCGDGNQLTLAEYPSYKGFDVSDTALQLCRTLFKNDSTKQFKNTANYDGDRADLTLSLDVIYHLVEDDVFNNYMKQLFDSSDDYVIVYASNYDDPEPRPAPHVKHRQFTTWIEKNKPNWQLVEKIDNQYPYDGNNTTTSHADFYIYKKI